MEIEKVVEIALVPNFEGISLDSNLEILSPSSGYSVGLDTLSFSHGIEFKAELSSMISALQGNPIGLWIEDGQIHVDRIKVIKDLSDALQLAKQYRQLAIWDFSARKAIYL